MPNSTEEKYAKTKAILADLIVACRGGGDLNPAADVAQKFLDEVDPPEEPNPEETVVS